MNEDLTYEIEVDTDGTVIEMEFDENGVLELDLTYMNVDDSDLEANLDSELDKDTLGQNQDGDSDGIEGDEDNMDGLDEEIDF